MQTHSIGLGKYLKANWLFLLFLFVGMLPMMGKGYNVAALLLIFIFVPIYMRIEFSWRETGILVFGLLYCLAWRGHTTVSGGNILLTILSPLAVFYAGKLIVRRASNYWQPFIIIVSIFLVIGIEPIIMNFHDMKATGELINFSRSLEGEDPNNDGFGATFYNVMMSLCIGGAGIMFVSCNNRLENILRIVISVMSIAALMASVHLLNRTSIVLFVISMMVSVFYPPFSRKRFTWLLMAIVIFILIWILWIKDTPFYTQATEGFTIRSDKEDGGFGSRDVRWLGALEQIFDYPFGYKFLRSVLDARYAHNAWLDIGIIGGIMPFVLFLIFTCNWIVEFWKFQHQQKLPHFQKVYFTMIAVVLFAQFFVEPIMQASLQYFGIFFLLWGYFSEINCVKKVRLKLKNAKE